MIEPDVSRESSVAGTLQSALRLDCREGVAEYYRFEIGLAPSAPHLLFMPTGERRDQTMLTHRLESTYSLATRSA